MQFALTRFRSFACVHDDLPAFRAAYIMAMLLSAALFNVGAFALLIVAHMSLDIVKYRELQHMGYWSCAKCVLKESILDLSMLSLALVFAVYLHHSAGVVIMNGFVRSEAFLLQMIGMLAAKIEIFCHATHVFSNVGNHLRKSRVTGWTSGQFVCGWLLFLCVSLLAIAPVLLPGGTEGVMCVMADQLIPWRL